MIEIISKNNQGEEDFKNLIESLLKKNVSFSLLQESPDKKAIFSIKRNDEENQIISSNYSIDSLDDKIKKLDNLLEVARKKQAILNKTAELKRIATSMGLPYNYFLGDEDELWKN